MNNCIICKNKNLSSLCDGILKCESCCHGQANTNLSEEELTKLYSRSYFFGDEYSDYLKDRKVLEKNFKLRINVLNRFIKKDTYSTLLEIGCAYGFFLNLMRDRFTLVQGIDICPDGIEFAKTNLLLNALLGDFLNQDFKNQSFDLVCLWDTIEHLRNPHLYLEKIARHTKKGSLIALTTGDLGSVNARLRRSQWRLIHPPTHLHYFSKRSLTKLLNRNGFEVIYSTYCGFYRSIDNIAYNILVLRNKVKICYEILRKMHLTNFNLYTNMFDIMYVIARKK